MAMRSDLKTPARGIGAIKEELGPSPASHGIARNAPEAEGARSGTVTTPEERRMLISQSAYLKAERRCFQSNPEQDWLEAEAEFDTLPVGSCSPDERRKQLNR
jgi:hypothetical protein